MSTMKKSILSDRASNSDQTVKAAGKIRPGIKVLTNAAMKNPVAIKLYNDGVRSRLKFSEIDKQIKDATNIANPSYPKNTPYYTVSSSDFGMPEIAHLIVEKYGEVRGEDKEKRLYRFPVVFHSDELSVIYPNEFRRFGTEPHYESHYGEDGVRYCRHLPPVTKEMLEEQKARRIKRVPRREKVIRGVCEPRVCPEFGAGQCKFRGRLHFYIPGIPTTGLLEMQIGSEDAAVGIWENLSRIKDMFGCIPRSNPKNPEANIFYISKVEEDKTYFDEGGNKKTGKQWVPRLQADIDIGGFLSSGSAPQLEHKPTPVAWLTAPKGMPEAVVLADDKHQQSASDLTSNATAGDDDESDGLELLEKIESELQLDQELSQAFLDMKFGGGWSENKQLVKDAVEMYEKFRPLGGDCTSLIFNLSILTNKNNIASADFQQFASMQFGKGYTRDKKALAQLLTQLQELDSSGNGVAKGFIDAQIANQRAAA